MNRDCKTNKTVLHVIDTTGPGGAEMVFVSLVDRVRGQGYKTLALIRGPGWVHDELVRRGVEFLVVDDRKLSKIEYLRRLLAILRDYKIDIIQSHLLGANLYCAMVGLLSRTPVIASFHGMVDVSSTERGMRIKVFLMNLGVTRYVLVSKSLRAEFLHKYSIKKSKSRVIYNGIDTNHYNSRKIDRIKGELSLPPSSILVGCLGNVRHAKAYDRVLRIAASLKRQEVDYIHFVVLGHQKQSIMEPLEELAIELRVKDRVHFLGFGDDTPEYLSNLDIFLLCSSSEGFSIATIEAMSASLPVVATRCGGPEELILNNQTGILVENGDIEALANNILALVADRARAAVLGEAARQWAQQSFDSKAMVASYVEEYSRC